MRHCCTLLLSTRVTPYVNGATLQLGPQLRRAPPLHLLSTHPLLLSSLPSCQRSPQRRLAAGLARLGLLRLLLGNHLQLECESTRVLRICVGHCLPGTAHTARSPGTPALAPQRQAHLQRGAGNRARGHTRHIAALLARNLLLLVLQWPGGGGRGRVDTSGQPTTIRLLVRRCLLPPPSRSNLLLLQSRSAAAAESPCCCHCRRGLLCLNETCRHLPLPP